MHRPSRQFANLKAKLERKLSDQRSKGSVGKKARRWKRWIAQYEALAKG